MKKTLFIATILAVTFLACKKKDSGAVSGGYVPATNNKPDIYGLFLGGEVIVDSSAVPNKSVEFVAVTYKYPDSLETDAGTVRGAGFTLSSFGTFYLYIGSGTLANNTIDWSVGGSSTVSPFIYTCKRPVPQAAAITSALTINRSSGYTIKWTSVSADSVTVGINDGNGGKVHKTLPGNLTSYTFSALELNKLTIGNTTTSKLSVSSSNYEFATLNSKKYAFQGVREYSKYKLTIL